MAISNYSIYPALMHRSGKVEALTAFLKGTIGGNHGFILKCLSGRGVLTV